jgi:DNA repair exonuclease SbcCD ATPase subunit
MSDHDEQIAERLAALEAKQNVSEVEAAALERALHTPPKHPGGAAGLNQRLQYRQDRALFERRRLHEEWQAKYHEQLETVAPKVEQLEAKLSELAIRRQEIERRYAAELAKVQAEGDRVRGEIGKLSTPPPLPPDPPNPDAVDVVAFYDMGHVQLVPRDVMDAQQRRREQEQKRSTGRRNP